MQVEKVLLVEREEITKAHIKAKVMAELEGCPLLQTMAAAEEVLITAGHIVIVLVEEVGMELVEAMESLVLTEPLLPVLERLLMD
ncbi:hypothetical protein C4572_03065 [Candidatus Parcubacteria bacterium]|nr:MAG: hypothetical protein C4572_03065 [Candidatus Parcubacteria bacterium]